MTQVNELRDVPVRAATKRFIETDSDESSSDNNDTDEDEIITSSARKTSVQTPENSTV